jgi:hypothetical protein
VDRHEAIAALQRLLPAQFEIVLFNLEVGPELLPGEAAPQASRAVALYRLVEQQNKLARLRVELERIFGRPLKIEQPQVSTTAPATILFLGANPSDTARIALDQEMREIDQRLRLAELRDAFRLEQAWAVRSRDLQACLLRYRPTIVHYRGHGGAAGGLVMEDEGGCAMTVGTAALADLFRILGRDIRCVVLSACFSEPQARAIAENVECVVGMTDALHDSSAIAFAGAFYQGLGYGESVGVAFELGKNQIDMAGLSQADVPRLVCRTGVDADSVFLHRKP